MPFPPQHGNKKTVSLFTKWIRKHHVALKYNLQIFFSIVGFAFRLWSIESGRAGYIFTFKLKLLLHKHVPRGAWMPKPSPGLSRVLICSAKERLTESLVNPPPSLCMSLLYWENYPSLSPCSAPEVLCIWRRPLSCPTIWASVSCLFARNKRARAFKVVFTRCNAMRLANWTGWDQHCHWTPKTNVCASLNRRG